MTSNIGVTAAINNPLEHQAKAAKDVWARPSSPMISAAEEKRNLAANLHLLDLAEQGAALEVGSPQGQ